MKKKRRIKKKNKRNECIKEEIRRNRMEKKKSEFKRFHCTVDRSCGGKG